VLLLRQVFWLRSARARYRSRSGVSCADYCPARCSQLGLPCPHTGQVQSLGLRSVFQRRLCIGQTALLRVSCRSDLVSASKRRSAVPARGLFWFPARFACCGPKSAGRSACFGRRCQGFLIPISRYSAPPVFSLRFLHRSAADFLACSCWVRDFLPRAQGAARFLICVLALCSSFFCVGCQIMIVQICCGFLQVKVGTILELSD
jgi:hypothetical protein